MDLVVAIEAFNGSSDLRIELHPTRDGRITASLPRVGRTILVQGSSFDKEVAVTAQDLAWLCKEAKHASAPGLALLAAALDALADVAGD